MKKLMVIVGLLASSGVVVGMDVAAQRAQGGKWAYLASKHGVYEIACLAPTKDAVLRIMRDSDCSWLEFFFERIAPRLRRKFITTEGPELLRQALSMQSPLNPLSAIVIAARMCQCDIEPDLSALLEQQAPPAGYQDVRQFCFPDLLEGLCKIECFQETRISDKNRLYLCLFALSQSCYFPKMTDEIFNKYGKTLDGSFLSHVRERALVEAPSCPCMQECVLALVSSCPVELRESFKPLAISAVSGKLYRLLSAALTPDESLGSILELLASAGDLQLFKDRGFVDAYLAVAVRFDILRACVDMIPGDTCTADLFKGNGRWALLGALRSKSVDNVRLLLEKGVSMVHDWWSDAFCTEVNLECMTLLIEKSDPECWPKEVYSGDPFVRVLLRWVSREIGAIICSGGAPHLFEDGAVRLFEDGAVRLFEFVLAKKPEFISLRDAGGANLLLHVLCISNRPLRLRLIKLFADKNPRLVSMVDNEANTALIAAASEGYEPEVALLLEYDCGSCKALLNAVNSGGNTALHCAAKCGHVGVVRTLLERGADSDIRNYSDESPLDVATPEVKRFIQTWRAMYPHVL